MAREKGGTGPGERVGRDEIYPAVGDPATEGLRTAAEVFGRDAIDPFAELVRTRPGLNASLTLTDNSGENPLTYAVVLTTDGATQSLAVKLEGDWSQRTEVPRGIPLRARSREKFSTTDPSTGEPLAKPGDRIRPGGPIGRATRGKPTQKRDTFTERLPEDEFRYGGIFRGYAVVDDQVVEPGTILCYVEKVEKVK